MVVYFSWLFFLLAWFLLFLGVFSFSYFSFVVEVTTPSVVFCDCPMVFCFDFVSMTFFSCVSLISSVVFFFSKYYMDISGKENSDQSRFLILLFLFVLSMFFLVFSYSWFLIMLGWDGLGVISFLLVIYYNDTKSMDSGLVTVFTNRIGDCLFLLSFSFMFWSGWFFYGYGTWFVGYILPIIVVLGCATKSAQMPFSSWLPAAMAAPTPVSSLVHSSTLVTAGIYLLIRFNFLLEEVYPILSVISLITMALAGLFAVYELDFKKVVAMSTLSQLGFMVFCISSGAWVLSFLHVMFHAFFKSSLFLSTGSLMHLILGNQDSRLFSGFTSSFFVKLYFSLSCMSLMGFPFSLGFYSKDMILGGLLFQEGGILTFLFVASCCFTVAYSLRLLYLGFLGDMKSDVSMEFGEDSKFFIPTAVLFFFSLFLGNYFMFYFLPVSMSFSFIELMVGIFVISGGFVFFKFSEVPYQVKFFFMSMFNLPYLVSFFSFNFMKMCNFKDDLSWGEVFASKGVEKILVVSEDLFKSFFSLKYLYIGLLSGILLLCLV